MEEYGEKWGGRREQKQNLREKEKMGRDERKRLELQMGKTGEKIIRKEKKKRQGGEK